MPQPTVVSVNTSATHSFTKPPVDAIELVAGVGIVGDVHAGATVRHVSRLQREPAEPNLRQVHLIHRELFDELAAEGYDISPGRIGENVTTSGIDLLSLPTGTVLHLGDDAVVRLTGLRNPCRQLEDVGEGLMEALLDRDEHGGLIRKAGVMSVVERGGTVRAGDTIGVALPHGEPVPLGPV